MLTIKAVCYVDGWAYFEQDNKLYLYQPPRQEPTETTESNMVSAVTKYGYGGWRTVDIPMENLTELKKHMRSEFLAIRKQRGEDPPTKEDIKKTLEYMTDELLLMFVEDEDTPIEMIHDIYRLNKLKDKDPSGIKAKALSVINEKKPTMDDILKLATKRR